MIYSYDLLLKKKLGISRSFLLQSLLACTLSLNPTRRAKKQCVANTVLISKERFLGIYLLPFTIYPGLILSTYHHFYTLYKERTALAFRERHVYRETDILNELVQRIYSETPLACYADVC